MEALARTTVRLPRAQMNRLKLGAVEQGRSIAELVRDGIGCYLDKGFVWESGPAVDSFVTMGPYGKGDVTDASVNHDKYLYGWDKES